jgi:hypothetical protein
LSRSFSARRRSSSVRPSSSDMVER